MEEWLVPPEEYIKAGVHLGTKVKTKDMQKFISKVRPDGLAIIDIAKTDERLRIVSKFVSKYEPDQILVVGRREVAVKPIIMFSKYTKIKSYPGRYPPGALTNPQLKNYVDPEVVIITDPLLDRNALKDAFETGRIIIAFCDTNNTFEMIDIAIPANNKGARSLALLYWILAREYLRNRGIIPKKGSLDVTWEAFAQE